MHGLGVISFCDSGRSVGIGGMEAVDMCLDAGTQLLLLGCGQAEGLRVR